MSVRRNAIWWLLLSSSLLLSSYAFSQEQDQEQDLEQDDVGESVGEICESEAHAAGMTSKEEIKNYVAQCVEELSQQENDPTDSDGNPQE